MTNDYGVRGVVTLAALENSSFSARHLRRLLSCQTSPNPQKLQNTSNKILSVREQRYKPTVSRANEFSQNALLPKTIGRLYYRCRSN
ncbi:hypothetical protein EVAR_73054_1 [Eumeta japonica]|uniref:Uncharacterized protein n=1 Tax=Eumeta variegata TaxID=151549 RepID=A0A4C1T0K6_EUMVA|nr:hypothetical protein EVAR_73054_1 [Eumeta japonica]